jgi:hypothetical protein
MATAKRGLVDKVKRVVARASTRGAMTLVEGTAAAVRTVDKLQEKLSTRRGKQAQTNMAQEEAPAVSATPAPEARRTSPRTERTNEARANAPRAPEPRDTEKRAPPRTSGRKTMPGTEAAAKRVKAPTAQAKEAPAEKKPRAPGEFKVKRGQKHLHSGR